MNNTRVAQKTTTDKSHTQKKVTLTSEGVVSTSAVDCNGIQADLIAFGHH